LINKKHPQRSAANGYGNRWMPQSKNKRLILIKLARMTTKYAFIYTIFIKPQWWVENHPSDADTRGQWFQYLNKSQQVSVLWPPLAMTAILIVELTVKLFVELRLPLCFCQWQSQCHSKVQQRCELCEPQFY